MNNFFFFLMYMYIYIYIFFSGGVAPGGGVAQAPGLAGLTPGPTLSVIIDLRYR